MNQKQFKILERLNDLVNTLDIFSDLTYEQKMRHRYYLQLLTVADNLAFKLNK